MKSIIFKIVTAASLFLPLQTYASQTHKIRFKSYLYIGSLGRSAEGTELAIVDQLIAVCGKLENVELIRNVKLNLSQLNQNVPTTINVNGKPGGDDGEAILTMSYPMVEGTAIVTCKN